jgi:ariadne-1
MEKIQKLFQNFFDEFTRTPSNITYQVFPSENVYSLYNINNNYERCEICWENLSERNIFRLGLCGDVYCRECIRNQIISNVNNQPCADIPLKCIKCKELILNRDIFELFKHSEMNFIFYQLTKYFMSTPEGEDYSWCENPDCQFIYKKSSYENHNSTIRDCPNCDKSFCLLCCSELTGNLHNENCKIMILKRLNAENRNWVIKNTKNCPKCNQIYEKSEGCNHMTCTRCRPAVHFCYICGEVLSSEK